ncbi:MAG: hypothetical protein KGL53_12460, partial [Elusimicrobia bacterium]|nr:hypothetical protein [Elusimicrobiota bacterium]
MRASLALLCAAALGASARPAGLRLGSLKELLVRGGTMARQWSPGAELYSILGQAPGNPERWSPAHWELFYGDPRTKDGYFRVVFDDGVLAARSGARGGAAVV